jgi:hypothetical protein
VSKDELLLEFSWIVYFMVLSLGRGSFSLSPLMYLPLKLFCFSYVSVRSASGTYP